MTTERDDLMGDIAGHLSRWKPQPVEIDEDGGLKDMYYDRIDNRDLMFDKMIDAIVEAAEYACAIEDDEPLPDCKHEHYDPNGRRMYGNCQDDEWGMIVVGGNND